jgi:hypothetical protein
MPHKLMFYQSSDIRLNDKKTKCSQLCKTIQILNFKRYGLQLEMKKYPHSYKAFQFRTLNDTNCKLVHSQNMFE